tara:strand:- start:3636 stop:4313 length:678 start_codon:yes stop_codon:yes gene_type:complete
MANDIDQIIADAKSQAKNDQILNFINNNLKFIITAIITILLLIAFIVSYNIYKSKKNTKYSSLIHQSFIYEQDYDYENAIKPLQEIINSDARQSIKIIAKLRYAAILVEQKEDEKAFNIYHNIAKCTSCDIFIRELSQLLSIKLWINNSKIYQKEDFKALIENYAKNAKYLYNNINEQLAIIEKNNKNWQKSYDIFYKIANDIEAYGDIKIRAQNYVNKLHQYIK